MGCCWMSGEKTTKTKFFVTNRTKIKCRIVCSFIHLIRLVICGWYGGCGNGAADGVVRVFIPLKIVVNAIVPVYGYNHRIGFHLLAYTFYSLRKFTKIHIQQGRKMRQTRRKYQSRGKWMSNQNQISTKYVCIERKSGCNNVTCMPCMERIGCVVCSLVAVGNMNEASK